jgi:hypothetical protein
MTPQEKSKELVYKYWDELEIGYSNSKKCALIAVDEIIIEIQDFAFNNDIEDYGIKNYWEKVKQEIEKL